MEVTIITPTNNPENLSRFLYSLSAQSYDGFYYQLIIVQESNDGFTKFNIVNSELLSKALVIKTKINHDYGAAGRDIAITYAQGEYILFWDDDNIYYPHALVSQYINAVGADIGISKVHHLNYVIPCHEDIQPGDIDTMNICVKRSLAMKVKWSNNGTKYSDYIYMYKLMGHNPIIHRSNVIIGRHL
jgi:glycosyltransferase involved in cell wall biosynthesis